MLKQAFLFSTTSIPVGLILLVDHDQEEVRLRALDNIINKLAYGIVQPVDLACDQLLISKLLQWFLRPATLKKIECLGLLLKICSVSIVW